MLRTRLYLGLLPLVLLLVGTGSYAILVSRHLAGSLQRELVVNYRTVLACQRMRFAATMMTGALTTAQRGDLLKARRDFDEQRSAFTRELMEQSAVAAGTPRIGLIEAVDRAFDDFSSVSNEILKLGGTGSLPAVKESETALYRVLNAIEELTQRDFAAAQTAAAHAGRLAATTERVLLITIASAFLLSLFLAWRLAASLLQPINLLTASAVALGEGDLDRTVPEFSADELGQLARAFNTMAAKLRAYREATVAKVLRTQRTMEATLASAPDPLFVVTGSGETEIRNAAAEQLGRAAQLGDTYPPELQEPLQRVLQTGQHYLPTDYARVLTLRVDREDRHYLPRILAIGDELTQFRGAAIILQDVTKFRLLDDAKTNLVGTVSHELKTPLTSLRMAVYLLLEGNLDGFSPQQRELVEGARDDADRLLRILDNLLDLTRLEAGASTLERTDCDVGTLLDEVAGEVTSYVGTAGQTLAVEVDAATRELPLHVDVARIRHVFLNLLTNASKYSPRGGQVTLRAEEAPGGFVRFAVRDEGPGIPEESVARVFDRFYRAPGQQKPGEGLGLAIAREIVVAHGGSIACANGPDGGAEFHFILPLAPATAEIPAG
ncbi:cell wall metabolism sensor histidine kinase WalK [Horticoccus luteus]|uniref:histidine kinase n=1 Tax=Horticoccus luteus TaxID=2862869 RepID=A0A8F9TX18_9BACT|nr:ATP-binding protein [Horticoccus luteus]QYM79414.1 cell wall metabolism sensor histidine kinase WalK [Horticoccus luteus]